ncbi:putative chromosome segregation protein [Golovinomyces cichoracearum]|uniref:Putative chromosome segregation protein n=1 Tax=Golovinomyces cichoracearum TaxID=62708 RepID=A0A420IJK1_9PEZI|nr:putative chromosome segregation protein [Golovinomyces cichoracearum]
MTPEKKAQRRTRAAESGATEYEVPDRRKNELKTASISTQKASKSKKKRLVVTDEISHQSASGADDIDEFNQSDINQPQINVKILRKSSGRSKAAKELLSINDTNHDKSPKVRRAVSRQPPKRKGRSKKASSPDRFQEKVIVETQESEVNTIEEADEKVERSPKKLRSQADSQSSHRPNKRRRTSSISDPDSQRDASLSRKIRNLNQKYESLQLRYNEVIELGIVEAEIKFDKLRKQIEENTSVTNNYLTSLKADLENKTMLAKETKLLKSKLSVANIETVSLQEKVKELEKSLAESQTENKILSTKLAVTRTAAVSVESVNSKVPNSAMKANGGIRMMGTAEAALTAQVAQLKEDLYSDLTGLLMRRVTRGNEKDCFDCIQTGRNGTLHFKLAVGNESSAESYDDIQCSYTPLLDPNRDKMLIELLPDYLVDEITFPRPHSAKFYARVVKALTEKHP